MAELEIRATIAPDVPRLLRLNHSVESDAVWQLELHRDARQVEARFREARLPRPSTVTYPHDPEHLLETWREKPCMYTALLDGEPAGYAVLVAHAPSAVAWLTDLVVDAMHRRNGIGTSLVEASQAWARTQQHRRLMLELPTKNVPAIRLAQKLGFEFCGYNDRYYLTQDVALFFARTLQPSG